MAAGANSGLYDMLQEYMLENENLRWELLVALEPGVRLVRLVDSEFSLYLGALIHCVLK